MASTNQSPEFIAAEKRYLLSATPEEKLFALEEMIKYAPKHKAGESLRANLKTRYKKLKESLEKLKIKQKSSGKQGIKKADMQAILVGLTNSGKSSVLSCLTNAAPSIAEFPYTTHAETIGTLFYEEIKIQIIDLPAIESEYFNQSLANTADTLLIVITNPNELEKIFPFLAKSKGEKLIILNKIDILTEQEKRKFSSQLQTKKYNFILFSCKTKENVEELKEKLWQSFHKIRIYTKQPGKSQDKEPVILSETSTVENLAEKIFHNSKKIREIKITGPSSKFPNQSVSLSHVLKDKDVVEFKVD